MKHGRRLTLATLAGLLMVVAGARSQGKFSGVFYGDYFFNVARDTAVDRANLPASALGGPRSNQGFVIRRVYFTYDQDLAEQFAMRYRLELDGTPNSSAQYAVLSNGNISVVAKDAWLRWKEIFAGSDLYFGIQPTSAYDLSEGVWAYRSLEKTIMDLRGIVSSRVLGIALRGKLDEGGMFGYWATVANANSGTQPKDLGQPLKNGDKYNLYSLHVGFKPTSDIVLALYGDFRPTFPVNDPASTAVPRATVSNSTFTGALFASYRRGGDFAVGAEAFTQQTSHAYTDPVAANSLKTLSRVGVSVFGWVNFSDNLGAVARYDYYDPKTGSDATEQGDSRNYILAGLVVRPAKNVQVVPNLQVETYESIPGGRSVDAAVTGRVSFIFSY
jgi:hypothetical protein